MNSYIFPLLLSILIIGCSSDKTENINIEDNSFDGVYEFTQGNRSYLIKLNQGIFVHSFERKQDNEVIEEPILEGTFHLEANNIIILDECTKEDGVDKEKWNGAGIKVTENGVEFRVDYDPEDEIILYKKR